MEQQKQALSVKEFCSIYCISVAKLYQLFAKGEGPRVTKLGRKILITRTAAEEWLSGIEAKTQQQKSSIDLA
jgi:predicted DNA-binding transcriptional regulator AlpA